MIPLWIPTVPRATTGWLLSEFDWNPFVTRRVCPVTARHVSELPERFAAYRSIARRKSSSNFGLARKLSTVPACLSTSIVSPLWTVSPAASLPRVCEQR
jgi:hypothetical protein